MRDMQKKLLQRKKKKPQRKFTAALHSCRTRNQKKSKINIFSSLSYFSLPLCVRNMACGCGKIKVSDIAVAVFVLLTLAFFMAGVFLGIFGHTLLAICMLFPTILSFVLVVFVRVISSHDDPNAKHQPYINMPVLPG